MLNQLARKQEVIINRARTLQAGSSDAVLRLLLGGSREIGSALGLDDDWPVRVIESTGNYGEIYERDLGRASTMRLPRGENNLREHGGVMTSPPPQIISLNAQAHYDHRLSC
jgi:general L-amino acid transport system substrate-binding protein